MRRLRVAIGLCVLVGCDRAPDVDAPRAPPAPGMAVAPVPVAPAPAPAPVTAKPPNPVTHELPADKRAALIDCWHARYETWTLRGSGDRGIEVIETTSYADGDYAARQKLPHPLMFDPADGSFAFQATGRIHAMMMIFQAQRTRLHASAFSSHDGTSYGWTGNNLTLTRCDQPIVAAD